MIVVNFLFLIPQAIFTEAFLSFLGVGLSAPTASLGTLIQEGRDRMILYPCELLAPLITLCVLLVVFHILAMAMEEEEADRLNMLDVRSLYVTYLSEEERVEAVRGIDFSAEEGKVTGIVGESGSGKSTAMLAVMGLLDHKAAVEAEKVSLFGNTVRAGDNAAIIFQDPLKCLNPTVKIGRQIAETVRNRKKCTWREAKKRSEELLDSVGIRTPG